MFLPCFEQVADAERLAVAQVHDVVVVLELAGEHADEAQVPDELVVDHLEHLADELLLLGRLELVRRAVRRRPAAPRAACAAKPGDRP